MIESTLKIARYCPLVIQGFSNFWGLFQGIMANPESPNHPIPFVFASDLADSKLPVAKWPFFGDENVELSYCTFKVSLIEGWRSSEGTSPLLTTKKSLACFFLANQPDNFFSSPYSSTAITESRWPQPVKAMCYRKEWPSTLWLPQWPCPLILWRWGGQIKVDTIRWISLR